MPLTNQRPGPEVIKLEFSLKLKIKRNDWLPISQSLHFILGLRLYSSFKPWSQDIGMNINDKEQSIKDQQFINIKKNKEK